MDSYHFPGSDLDRPEKLLALLGSFWSSSYAGSELVKDLLFARAQLDAQAHLSLLDLVAAMSRFTVPLFHCDNWYSLLLLASERNTELLRYDGSQTYRDDTELVYGGTIPTSLHAWKLPAGLADVRIIMDRITASRASLVQGTDFFIEDGKIFFQKNPFNNASFKQETIFVDNVPVDHTCQLWLYRGQWEWHSVYRQFGYVLGLQLASSESYRDLLNAIFDCLVEGTSQRAFDIALAALGDAPFARSPETIQYVGNDAQERLLIVSDKTVYRYGQGALPLVQVNDQVAQGDALADAIQVFEFGSGQVPASLRGLVVGPGLLAAGFFQELVFENRQVPLQVSTAPDGFTRVEFEVSGWPGDIVKLWDDVHAAGVAKNETLAMLLDTRPPAARTTQPTALALPATVNPLEFLLKNLLRDNLVLVQVKPQAFGDQALGLGQARFLRKIIPPHTAVLFAVELAVGPEQITMEEAGTETEPGYTEQLAVFLGKSIVEELDPADFIEERVKVKQVQGTCR